MTKIRALITLAVFCIALSAPTAAQEPPPNEAFQVPPGGRLVLDLSNSDYDRFLGSTSGDAEIVTKPLLGNAYTDGEKVVYFANPKDPGLDRMVVRRTDDESRTMQVELVVGQPNIAATDVVYERLAELLFALLIIAIFLELALTFLFKTRTWTTKLESRTGMKTIFTLVAAVIVAAAFDLNIFGEVVEAVQRRTYDSDAPRIISYGITALLLAGGSGTIYKLYETLRIRPPAAPGTSGAGLKGAGFLALTIDRSVSAGTERVQVLLDDELVGTIEPSKKRFPDVDYLQVNAGAYTLKLTSNDASGAPKETARNIGLRPGQKDAPLEIPF